MGLEAENPEGVAGVFREFSLKLLDEESVEMTERLKAGEQLVNERFGDLLKELESQLGQELTAKIAGEIKKAAEANAPTVVLGVELRHYTALSEAVLSAGVEPGTVALAVGEATRAVGALPLAPIGYGSLSTAAEPSTQGD